MSQQSLKKTFTRLVTCSRCKDLVVPRLLLKLSKRVGLIEKMHSNMTLSSTVKSSSPKISVGNRLK